MKFKVEREALVRELELLQAVSDKSASIPILGNVKLRAAEDRLELVSTDLDMALRCSCAATVTREGEITLPAARFFHYVKSCSASQVGVEAQTNHWVQVSADRAKARLAGMAPENFPELPAAAEASAEIPAAALAIGFRRTILAVSDEQSRFTLNGALLTTEADGRLQLAATDGHRLALSAAVWSGTCERLKLLVPLKAMKLLLKLLAAADPAAVVSVSHGDNHMFFEIAGRAFMSRKLAGQFPDYERVLPKEQPHLAVMVRAALLGALERVGQFSDDKSHCIRLSLAKGELRLKASVSDLGESEESVEAEYDGPEFETGYNADYLVDFLKAITEERVQFLFKSGKEAGELRPVNADAAAGLYRYVIMPMRI